LETHSAGNTVLAVKMPFVLDWVGNQIEVGYSHGGVMAVADFSRNFIRTRVPVWPPAAIVQKLYNSRLAYAFRGEAFEIVTRQLQYYCDLQSIHSEDAITWSFFGALTYLPAEEQAQALNWILTHLHLEASNKKCEISLWRRVPHPETLVPGGPEIDFLLAGDRDVIMGEAKWRSAFAAGQGVGGNMNQIQLRQQFLREYGLRVFGQRNFLVLGLLRHQADYLGQGNDFRAMTWAEISHYDAHPDAEEFRNYLRWKEVNSLP
jgi:hypothetical protein